MILLLVVLSLTCFCNKESLALAQGKTYVKVWADARIDSVPIGHMKNSKDADTCALVCFENSNCNLFVHNVAIGGQCHIFNEKYEKMRIVLEQNWEIFIIKGKT